MLDPFHRICRLNNNTGICIHCSFTQSCNKFTCFVSSQIWFFFSPLNGKFPILFWIIVVCIFDETLNSMQTSTLKLNINKSQINNKKSVYKISTKLSHHRLIHLVDNWSPTFFDMRLTFIFILYKKIFSLHDSRILLIIKEL